GRGSCDTKGTGAAMLWALREYARGGDQAFNIALLFTVDEEMRMTGVQSFIANNLPTLGWDVRGVIVGEPTELRPIVAHNGSVRWRLITRGRAAHSSNPQAGESAISKMVKVVDRLEAEYIANLSASHPLIG